jgi:hypothetical protein
VAVLTFDQLRQATQIYVQEWANLTVKDEPLIPADNVGTNWVSFWDNWLLPPDPFGLDPLIMLNGIALTVSSDYTITQSGDSVRGRVQLVTPAGSNAILLATYKRSLFRNQFWINCIQSAADDISMRLLNTHLDITRLDDTNDPWAIIVKQAGLNTLINLQTLLVGFGKTTMEGMTIDLLRAAEMIKDGMDHLYNSIDRDVVAWRWRNSPVARQVWLPPPLPGPFGRVW